MWSYKQSTGEVFDTTGAPLAVGYSGAKPDGYNNPSMQNVANVGPTPRGQYAMLEPRNDPKTGEYSIPLVPAPENEMFGRSDFLVHGDSIESPGNASEGCIVLPLSARVCMWTSGDHDLEVVE
jgi:hypothetical protein